jgi:lipoprotein signal peptidase
MKRYVLFTASLILADQTIKAFVQSAIPNDKLWWLGAGPQLVIGHSNHYLGWDTFYRPIMSLAIVVGILVCGWLVREYGGMATRHFDTAAILFLAGGLTHAIDLILRGYVLNYIGLSTSLVIFIADGGDYMIWGAAILFAVALAMLRKSSYGFQRYSH